MKTFIYILLSLSLGLPAFASEYNLIGIYLLEYSVFKIDVYEISYYRGKNSEKLVLDYKVGVSKKHSIEGWKVGLKHKLEQKAYQPKAEWIYDHTPDVEKGDKLTLVKSAQSFEIYKNNDLVGQTNDPMIIELAFEPWLGEKPVDEKLKAALLGKK